MSNRVYGSPVSSFLSPCIGPKVSSLTLLSRYVFIIRNLVFGHRSRRISFRTCDSPRTLRSGSGRESVFALQGKYQAVVKGSKREVLHRRDRDYSVETAWKGNEFPNESVSWAAPSCCAKVERPTFS